MVAVAVGIIFLIIRKIDEVSDATKLQKDFCHSIRIGCVRVTLYPFHFQNLSRNRNRNLETYRSQSLYLKSQKKKEMTRIKQAISFQLDATPKAAPSSYRQAGSYLFFKQTFRRVLVFLLI